MTSTLVVAVLLGVTSATATLLGPWMLSHGTWWLRRPRLALGAWHALFVLGTMMAATAGILFVVAATGIEVVAGRSISTGAVVLGLQCLVTALVVGALAALIGQLELVLRGARDERASLAALMATHGHLADDLSTPGCEVVILDSPGEIACCLTHGRRAIVCLSEDVLEALDDEALRALLLHEQAHARQRHDAFVLLAQIAYRWTPWLPGAKRLRQMTSILVELAADDHALRAAGPASASRALETLERGGARPDAALRRSRIDATRSARST